MKNLIILLLLLTMKSYGQSMTLTPNGQQFSILNSNNNPFSNTSNGEESKLIYYTSENYYGKGFYYNYHDGIKWQWGKIKQSGENNLPQTAQVLSETISNNNLEGIGVTKTGSLHFDFEGWEKNITSNVGFNYSDSDPIYNNTGIDVIFWGGKISQCFGIPSVCNDVYTNTGKFYRYQASTWTNLPTIPTTPSVFAARANHTNAYANTLGKMIVWGGFDGTNYLNDMAIFTGTGNPAGGTWSRPSSNDSPNARAYHSAVTYSDPANSNQSKMIIWGGRNPSQAFNDGKIFTVSTISANNQWANTNISAGANTPTARYGHTAVLYNTAGDTKMVIWGGQNFGGSYLDNGAVYDVSTNSWSPMAALPNGVYYNEGTAICSTLAKLCIHASKYNTDNLGAIYTIETNTWATITDNEGPTLKNHSAIFHPSDNTKLLFFGGIDKTTNTANTKVYTYDITNAKWLEPMDLQPTITPTEITSKPHLIPIGTINDGKILVWQPPIRPIVINPSGFGGIYKPISDKTFFTFEKR